MIRPSLYILMVSAAVVSMSACQQNPSPVTRYGVEAGAGSAGMHTVKQGETLYGISKRYKIDMPAIISVNELSAPFRLAPGQRLELPPPREYTVRQGDTLYGVSRIFNVSQKSLADLNNLSSPFKISRGQTLKLPTPQDNVQTASATAPSMPAVPLGRVNRTQSPEIEQAVLKAPQQRSSAPQTPTQNQSPAQAEKASVTSTPPKASVPPVVENSHEPFKLTKPSQFMRPVSGHVISAFGPKEDGLHNDGINIAAARNTPVKAAADGEVVYAGNALKGYGNLVLIKHGGGYLSAYGHLGRIDVKKGDFLRQGDSLGVVGTSGQVGEPQLHFELREGTTALDPAEYI